jgi:iron complex outermembrane recepter protein
MPAQTAAQSDSALEEVVVTARRREESAQKTPVSVSVFNAAALKETGTTDIEGLTALVPGVNLTGSGARSNTIFIIRGLSRGVVGQGQSAVVTYLDDVPLSVWAAGLPTYDMASVEVLKGPQGTLFGRNASAGAVLANTAPPTDRFGGYIDGTFGSYDWHSFEGAVNLPLISDKLDVRIAGKLDRRDGYIKNMSFPGKDFNNRNEDDLRVSVLARPFDHLTNTTIFEYQWDDTNGDGVIPVAYQPGGFADLLPWTNGTLLNPLTGTPCNNAPICSVQAVVARQQAVGVRKAWDDSQTRERTRIEGVINTTRYEFGDLGFGDLSAKNIFSYRSVNENLDAANGDGSEMSFINTHPVVDNRTITDELQFFGTTLRGKLNWIAGLFYSDFAPNGGQRLTIQALAIPGTPITAPPATAFGPLNGFLSGASGTSDYYYEQNEAAYLHGSYDLGVLLNGLTIDAGVRYSKDKQRVCDLANQFESNPIIGPSACPTTPGANVLSGYKDSVTTWNAGLDYQVTDDILTYFTTRRGYRMGGINTPVFVGTLTPFQRYAPEIVQDYEIGLKTNWTVGDTHGHFNIDAYKSDISNLQAGIATGGAPCPDGVCDPAHFPSNQTFYGNVGKATVKGIETEASISPLRGLTLSVGAAWDKREIDALTINLPATLPASAVSTAGVASFAFLGSPDYSYTADLRYVLPLHADIGQVAFNTNFFSIGKFNFGSLVGGGYSTVNFRLEWSSIYSKPFDVALFVNNATDTVGLVAGSLTSQGIGLVTGLYNEPRMIGAQLRYHFGAE